MEKQEKKKQITIDFDNQPRAKEPLKGEVQRLERKPKKEDDSNKK